MGFKRVRFNNFKNIEPREMQWFPGLNLITGENGAGKTNILEGMNILSGWGPLERGTKAKTLPNWESGAADVQLTGELETNEIIRVKVSTRTTIKVDEKSATASALRQKVPALTFLPEDMSIVEGSAQYRRRLIDMLLAIIIPSYAFHISEFRRGIKQKTEFLKRGIPSLIADKTILPHAAWIWKMRHEGVKLLSICLEETEELAPAKITLTLKRGGGGYCDSLEDDYIKSITINREREEAIKFPLVGPHRDDIIISSEGRTASEAFSRGLRRRTAAAIILAASEGVRRKTGINPILLLDEVTAELDAHGRELLFDALIKRNTQVFAATAEPFEGEFPGTVYRVSDGKLIKI